MLNSVVSGLALLVGVFCLMTKTNLGGGMSDYDFSSPEKTMRSVKMLEAKADILAMSEYRSFKRGDRFKEELDTLEVHDEADYDGKKLLFISFERGGKKRYDVDAFEKDADSGKWMTSYLSGYKLPENSEMKKRIEKWEEKSEK